MLKLYIKIFQYYLLCQKNWLEFHILLLNDDNKKFNIFNDKLLQNSGLLMKIKLKKILN